MDIDIDTVRVARSRADCALRPGEAFLAGGTFLYSEPVAAGVTGLVDLTGMGWEPWSVDGSGLRVSGTCTLEELLAGPGRLGASSDGPYRGLGIVGECVSALTLSAKVARTATVGGNLALGLPAGSMVGLFAALSGVAVIWTPGVSTGSTQRAGSREVAVTDLVTGAGAVALSAGEVLREVRVPAVALGQRTALRRTSLAPNGRTAAMVTGRRVEEGVALVLTASVPAPHVLLVREDDHDALDQRLDWISGLGDGAWYEDTHGSREWRAAMTRRLAHEALEELGGVV